MKWKNKKLHIFLILSLTLLLIFSYFNNFQIPSVKASPHTMTLSTPTVDGWILFDMDTVTYTRDEALDFDPFYWWSKPTLGASERAYVEWDISGIESGSTITKVEFRYHGKDNPATDNCYIYAMAYQPSVQSDDDAGNKVIFDDAGDGTAYLDNNAVFPEVGTGKDVGGASGPAWDTDPKSDVESALAVGWFALGFKNDEVTDGDAGAFYSERYTIVDPSPTLYITYIPPAGNGENSVTLNSPSDDATETSYAVDFKFTPIFYQTIQNACLWTDEGEWSCKQWNTTTVQNDTQNTISETFSSEGTFLWNIRVFNSTYGLFAGANFTVTIDIPTPPISYPSYLDSHDGNCLMYGGIQLKPNNIHTYIPQFNGRYKNITLNSGTLGLSKSDCAYNIACSTNDNVTVNLNKWFYSSHYNTEFQPNAETESTLTFTVNTRERGEPHEISGVSTWSYNEDSTTLTLTCANYSKVSMWFLSDAEKQFIWITVRIPTWMGIAGIALMVLSPMMIVYFIKEKEYETSMIIALMGFALGFAMIVAWLWG